MDSAAQPARGRRAIPQPGEPAADLAHRLGLDEPALQQRYQADLARVRDAEARAEAETDGIRLR